MGVQAGVPYVVTSHRALQASLAGRVTTSMHTHIDIHMHRSVSVHVYACAVQKMRL